MLIKQLVLRNFGLYRGEQRIDLAPRSRGGEPCPVVLIGGQNGAGKTTLLDAVRLCLYGRLALGPRVSETDYLVYLREKIHRRRDALSPIQYASVALEFEYAHAGRQSTYFVQRSWDARGASGAEEAFRVLRDGEELADVEAQFWPEFVRSLVPLGVSQLFFFDGEKIKRLAEEESETETLAESVKALLGLDLIERLQADLDLYASRYMKKTATGSQATRLTELERIDEELQRQLAAVLDENTALQGKLDDASKQIARVERRLAQRGEGLAAQRSELQQRKADLTARQTQVERALRDLCDANLPFALCRSLSEQLTFQLQGEAAQARWAATHEAVREALALVEERLLQGKFARVVSTKSAKTLLQSELSQARETLLAPPDDVASVELIHGLSDKERELVCSELSDAITDVPRQVASLTVDLNSLVSQLRDVQDSLNRTPEHEEIEPIIRQLSTAQEQHASLALEVTLKGEQRVKLERDLATNERERARIHKSQEEAEKVSERLHLARSARAALNDYLTRLAQAKLVELQAVVMECFSTLCRKPDLVHSMTIDPTTYEVTLLDRSGDVVPKSSLSAGEKQIYAVALLWALARVSGRPLPMIVDTPLGRLDSAHRANLLERYFPRASHQVIILSTDTEVSRTHAEVLAPHTSHSVHLENHDGYTEVAAGYFWKEADDATPPA